MALIFVGHDPGRLAAPFGPSHDGFNAAVYMAGGRAIVEEGLFASHFGASSRTTAGDFVVYAHHPPMVYLADAAAQALPGSPEVAARLPAVVASLAVLVLLAFVLAAAGLPSGAAGIGLLVACATPMFVLFGATIEPHVLGLAPMAGLTLLWQRARVGLPAPAWAFGAMAALAALTSWQAALFSAGVGAVILLVERRVRPGFAVLAGTATTAILVGLWIWWAYGGLIGEFAQRTLLRTGAGPVGHVTFRHMVRQQMGYLADLFPLAGWLVVPIAALGLFDRRTRPLVALSLGTVLAYAVIFRNGASDHDYWLYGLLLPLALSAAAAADAVARWFRNHARLGLVPALLGGALAIGLGITLWRPSAEQSQRRYAASIGAQARTVGWPPAQRYAYFAPGDPGPTDLLPWLLFYSRRQPFGVSGPESVPQDEVVLRIVDGRLVLTPGEQAPGP